MAVFPFKVEKPPAIDGRRADTLRNRLPARAWCWKPVVLGAGAPATGQRVSQPCRLGQIGLGALEILNDAAHAVAAKHRACAVDDGEVEICVLIIAACSGF